MTVLKRSLILGIALLICSLILGGCKQTDPDIAVVITLSNITEEEYKQINDNNKPEGATINDLKKLYVDVKLTNSKSATERMIKIPDLFIIDRYDRVRTTSGGRSELNNTGTDDTAKSTAQVIFDSKGLSEQKLRDIYGDSEIYIAYKMKNRDLVEKRVSIGDNLRIAND